MYGGPTTLPCGHNGCVSCMVYLQQRSPQCPLCRADFPPDMPLSVNYDLKEMLRLAQVRWCICLLFRCLHKKHQSVLPAAAAG